MSGFLIEFNRRTRVLDVLEFAGERGPQEALEARLDREASRGDVDLEIVSLNANSIETVRATHARYFDPALAG